MPVTWWTSLRLGALGESGCRIASLVCSAGRVQDSVVTRICQTNSCVWFHWFSRYGMLCVQFPWPSHKTYFVPTIGFNWMWLFYIVLPIATLQVEKSPAMNGYQLRALARGMFGNPVDWWIQTGNANTGWLIGDDKPSQYGWTDEFIWGWSLEREH